MLEPESITLRDAYIGSSEIGYGKVREDVGAVALHREGKFIRCRVLDSKALFGIPEVAVEVRWANSLGGG
jgi:hypothetical protein